MEAERRLLTAQQVRAVLCAVCCAVLRLVGGLALSASRLRPSETYGKHRSHGCSSSS